MSSEDGRLPPPPPLRSPLSPGLGGPLRDRHGLAQPPTITTALTGPQPTHSAWSASTLDTPYSPYASAGLSPVSQLPPSLSGSTSPLALRPPASFRMEYNPQQWGRGGPSGGEYRPHTRLAAPSGGADALNGAPSPPPPYSPPSSQTTTPGARLSAASPQGPSEYNSPVSMVSMVSPFTTSDGSRPTSVNIMSMGALSAQGTPAFPPPPSRDRSGSRHRQDGQRSLFNLSALTSRNKNERSANANAMEALRQNTNEALAGTWGAPGMPTAQLLAQRRTAGTATNRSSLWIPPDIVPEPPASRRSASTSAISSQSDSNSQWEPGMQLPPPPPGPPPSDSRSSSLSREPSGPSGRSVSSDRVGSVPALSMPTRRPPPQRGTRLEPVPPTPADWSESGYSPLPQTLRAASHSRERSTSPLPLRIDTSGAQGKHVVPPKEISTKTPSSQPSTSSTAAAPSARDAAAKGIRERRSESRAAKDRVAQVQDSQDPDSLSRQSSGATSAMPADLVLTPPSSGISRQGAVKKPRASMSPGPPRPLNLRKKAVGLESTSTPPFSPGFNSQPSSSQAQDVPTTIPPKALPTPPPQRLSNEYLPSSAATSSDSKTTQRPESIEHDNPPTSARDSTPQGGAQSRSSTEADAFAESSLERHKRFIELERSAATDQERLELFAEFVVTESRLRRDRYSAAFSAMGADIFELTRELWKSYQPSPTTLTKLSTAPELLNVNRKDSIDSSAIGTSPVSRSNFTPRTESESPSDVGARESGFWNAYQPVLSPIPSMNISTVPDEELSRGRPSSRWWESSGSRSAGGGQKLERSKRESKYMGVPREARLQWQDEQVAQGRGDDGKQPEKAEYPPEKVGWHEDGAQGPASSPQHSQFWRHSAPNTPDPHGLDVSRLVTLPPPYPRHYPAMNNNHPDLTSVRTNLRALTDLTEASTTKESFRARSVQQREQLAEEAADRRRQMRHNIQEQLELGQMTYASAAEAEAQFNDNEAIITQQAVQRDFDAFQPEVMSPLHALLSERVTRATACILQLQSGLAHSADDLSRSQPQEEGDELPELLEKLNLLKWLFDARETLHRELFELENERNDRYREVIVTPFRVSGAEHKITDAELFFRKDALERKTQFIKARLKRWEEFAKVIEDQVSLGVEAQLNAFWDIAPGLLAVVQKVPEDLKGFDIHIPQAEYDENPAYYDHPLQYLYSLLTHAEKATYQYIESQTNLMCLLHEAMTGVMVAGLALMENQRIQEGEEKEAVKVEMQEIRKAEEDRLTMDLKEKVNTIEAQWRDGLGMGLTECKSRAETFLRAQGGWDESLE